MTTTDFETATRAAVGAAVLTIRTRALTQITAYTAREAGATEAQIAAAEAAGTAQGTA